VEKVGGLVPVNPHATQVIAKQIVKRIAGKETKTVRDPVGLIGVVIEIGFRLLAQLANCFGALFIGSRPDTQGDAVEGM
jgi:hypothetical protein